MLGVFATYHAFGLMVLVLVGFVFNIRVYLAQQVPTVPLAPQACL